MKITWVTRTFLDYRIPVYQELNSISGGNLTVIYNKDLVPPRCVDKISNILGEKAIGLTGEISFSNYTSFANSGISIPIQRGLISKVISTNPDIMLTDGFYQWTYAAYWVKIFKKVPHIMLYERTHYTERNAPWWRTGIRKIFSKFIDKIGCNGIQTYNYLIDVIEFPEQKLFIGNMAADTIGLENDVKKIRKNEKGNKNNKLNNLTFLYVGQIIPRKGIMEMLIAWAKFNGIATSANLILLGDGDQKEYAKNIIKERCIKNVQVMGKVDYSVVSKFYASADIFIIPTLEDNWSLVVPEAMSCELPIICSKYNGCWPELVTDKNGWVFDPLDEHDFIKTLKDAWNHRTKWEEMGKASKEIVANYSAEKITNQIYRALLNQLS